MKAYLIRLLVSWLVRLGYRLVMHGLSNFVLNAARQATAEAERKGGEKSGEGKRAQALRMMMNLVPEASHREIALAIELCLPQ
ncbi:hypothetical protein LCGC14_2395990 [marine sediment metagenome]|uniref:Uncharacterized protein n=1 Tax=marine sediment metagenome TaxID=412755 RepID=A0A0F9BWR8_9ZZZZ